MVRSFKRPKDGRGGRRNTGFWYSFVSLPWHKRILSKDKGKFVVENNSLAHLLAAANKRKPGTTANYESGTQEAIREACSRGTPVSCETAMATVGSAIAWSLLPGVAAITNAGVGLLINGEINPNDVILG